MNRTLTAESLLPTRCLNRLPSRPERPSLIPFTPAKGRKVHLEVSEGAQGIRTNLDTGERRKERRRELLWPEHPLGTGISESPPRTSRHYEKM